MTAAVQAISSLWGNNKLPIKIVLPIVTVLLGCAFWLGRELEQLQRVVANAWSIHEMEQWQSAMKDQNPDVVFLSPREIRRLYMMTEKK